MASKDKKRKKRGPQSSKFRGGSATQRNAGIPDARWARYIEMLMDPDNSLTDDERAAALGVTRTTLYRWRTNTEFQAWYNKIRDEAFKTSVGRVKRRVLRTAEQETNPMWLKAAELVLKLMPDPEAPAGATDKRQTTPGGQVLGPVNNSPTAAELEAMTDADIDARIAELLAANAKDQSFVDVAGQEQAKLDAELLELLRQIAEATPTPVIVREGPPVTDSTSSN